MHITQHFPVLLQNKKYCHTTEKDKWQPCMHLYTCLSYVLTISTQWVPCIEHSFKYVYSKNPWTRLHPGTQKAMSTYTSGWEQTVTSGIPQTVG